MEVVCFFSFVFFLFTVMENWWVSLMESKEIACRRDPLESEYYYWAEVQGLGILSEG